MGLVPLRCAVIWSVVLVGGRLGAGVALGAGVVLGAGVALGAAVAPGDAGVAPGEALGAAALLVMFAEQMIRAPPPLAEPLHWLILRAAPEDFVPVAVQVEEATRPPPFAEPLHWVIVAPEVVAGKGSQTILMPPPPAEPTHWFTVAAVAPGLTPMKLFVILTLHRSVASPPLSALLHCVTAVTGLVRTVVLFVQLVCVAGGPAAPRHSRTVTVADPPLAVIWLTIVTSQMRPWPPPLPTPLPHVVVGAIVVAADAPPASASGPRSRSPPEKRIARKRRMAIRRMAIT